MSSMKSFIMSSVHDKFESIECCLKVRFSSVWLWWCLNPKIPFWTPDLDRTKTWTDALTTPSEVSCWYRCPTGRSKNILSRVKSYFQIYRTHICTEICHPHAQRCTLFVTRANSNVNWLRTFRQFRSTESLANFTANIVKHKRPPDLLMGKHSTTWVLQYFSLKSSEQGKLYFWIKRVRELCLPPSLTFFLISKREKTPRR